MEQYNVTGMSCAACSSRVEKAVSKVPGVTSCSVSLLTNSMGVEGTASSHDIITAVEQAGYGASLKGANKEQVSMSEAEEALEDHETPVLKRRLIASIGFLLVLMYFSMGHMMWDWPLPAFLTITTLPWDLSSFCLPESSWSSTRNSSLADLRVCGTVPPIWTHWLHSAPWPHLYGVSTHFCHDKSTGRR